MHKGLNIKFIVYPALLFCVAFLTLECTRESLSEPSNHRNIQSDAEQEPESVAYKILEGARREVHKKTVYKETYEVLSYPGGDVNSQIGVCTDLVIRAFRNADIDIQKLLHEDRKLHPECYPTEIWEYKKPDKNIDHRRCQNLVVFFDRFAKKIDTHNASAWKPGDVIFFVKDGKKHLWHVGIISDKVDTNGKNLMYHLYPPHCQESPVQDYESIHSIYRWEDKATTDE